MTAISRSTNRKGNTLKGREKLRLELKQKRCGVGFQGATKWVAAAKGKRKKEGDRGTKTCEKFFKGKGKELFLNRGFFGDERRMGLGGTTAIRSNIRGKMRREKERTPEKRPAFETHALAPGLSGKKTWEGGIGER